MIEFISTAVLDILLAMFPSAEPSRSAVLPVPAVSTQLQTIPMGAKGQATSQKNSSENLLNAVDPVHVKIERWETTNGADVYFIARPELPMLDVAVIFNAGSARDEKKLGLASLTNGLFDEGAGTLDADQIATEFDRLGAEFNSTVERDKAVLQLRVLTQEAFLQPAVKVFNQLLTQPIFSASALKREKNRVLQQINYEKQFPSYIASRAFFSALYNGPYATPIIGTETTIPNITESDVKKFYQQYYVAKNAKVILVGALDEVQAHAIAEKLMHQLSSGKPASELPKSPDASATLQNISFPSSQTHVLMGAVAVDRKDPDFYPLQVGNYILGGSPASSRLFLQVREREGLTYSIYSILSALQARGPFVIAFQTRNEARKKALELVQKILNDFVTHGPSADELFESKKSLICRLPSAVASNAAILQELSNIAFYELPLSTFDDYPANIAAVKKEDVQRAFQRIIKNNAMITVAVGN